MEPRWRRGGARILNCERTFRCGGSSALCVVSCVALLCTVVSVVNCSPVLLGGSLLNFQGAISSPARNIRHVPCISRKTGEGGTCMFAIDCLKSNGSHLGTCIDRFYFGSCCRLPDTDLLPQIEDNTIFGNYDKPFVKKPEDDNALNAMPVESSPSTSTTPKTTVKTSNKPLTTEVASQPSSLTTKRPTVSIISSISTKPQEVSTSTLQPIVVITSAKPSTQTEPPYKLSTFQSVSAQKPHITTSKPTIIASSPQPQPQFSSNITRITMKPLVDLTNGTNSKPSSLATIKPIITFKPTVKPVKVTTKPNAKPTATPKPTATKKPITQRPIVVTSASPIRTPTNPGITIATVLLPSTFINETKNVTVAPLTTSKPLPISTVQTSKPSSPIYSPTPSSTASLTTTTLPLASTVTNEPSSTTVKTIVITAKIPTTISSQKITVTDKPTQVTEVKPAISSTEPTKLKPTSLKPFSSSNNVNTTTKVKPKPATSTQKVTTAITSPKPTSTVSLKTTTYVPKVTVTTTEKAKVTTPQSTVLTLTSTTSNPVINEIEDTAHISKPALTTAKPGFVTWTNSIQTTILVPSTSYNSSSEASWSPITTPEGWILLSSPTSPTYLQKPLTPTTAKPVPLSTPKPVLSSNTIHISVSTSKPLPILSTPSSPSSPKPIPPHLTKPALSSNATSATTTKPAAISTSASPVIAANGSIIASSTTSNTSAVISTTVKSTVSPIEAVTSPNFSTSGLNMSDFKDVCGRRLWPEARIVGGAKSSFGKWPWQISLRQWKTSTYLHKCGAALLNENWAITAAHCVDSVPPSDLLLRLGEYDLASEEEPYGFQERRVQIVASHPQFDPRTFEYDLALLRFHEPVVFQPNILPVCVPGNDDNYIGKTAYVTGWGRLYEDGPLPSILQEVSVPIINNSVCETMYRSAGFIEHIPNIFICAGWRKGGFDSCEGDSGGPMVLRRDKDDRFVLAGIISWGIGCAEPNQPGVYTRISEFRDWINQILQF